MRRTAQLLRSFLSILITTAGQGIQFLWLAVSSRAELSAEVLFLRKQLAFYQEHQVQPRKLTDAARFSLVLWSQLFNIAGVRANIRTSRKLLIFIATLLSGNIGHGEYRPEASSGVQPLCRRRECRRLFVEIFAGRRRASARAVCAGVECCLSDDFRPTFFLAQHLPNCSDWEH